MKKENRPKHSGIDVGHNSFTPPPKTDSPSYFMLRNMLLESPHACVCAIAVVVVVVVAAVVVCASFFREGRCMLRPARNGKNAQ